MIPAIAIQLAVRMPNFGAEKYCPPKKVFKFTKF